MFALTRPLLRPLVRTLVRASARKGINQIVKSGLRSKGRWKVAPRPKPKKNNVTVVGGMPMYRRRRIVRRRKPVYRRRRYVKKTVNKIHTFVRWCDKDSTYGDYGLNQISETGANQNLTYQFKLDQVSGVSDFTNLYDGYKINKVQLYLEPLIEQSSSSPTVGAIAKKIRVVHDYNDASPLTDEDDYLQYGNCKSYFPWSKRGIRITLYPKLNNIIENVGGVASGYTSMNSNRQFLNIATDEVPHFGIKIFVPGAMTVAGNIMFRVRAKFWLSMRGTK